VEVDLHSMTRVVAGLKADHDAMRKDRDEWRWRAERLLADQERGFLGRLSNALGGLRPRHNPFLDTRPSPARDSPASYQARSILVRPTEARRAAG
jgi:hypothetical protein